MEPIKGKALLEISRDVEVAERRHQDATPVRAGAGILLADETGRRLVERACVGLELTTILLDGEALDVEALAALELIIADEPAAGTIQLLMASPKQEGECVHPALIAATSGGTDAEQSVKLRDSGFAAVLSLSQSAETLAAQLSFLLHSQRAFTRRYETAIEELHLNRRIFRSVTNGICVVSATEHDMPILYVNPAFEVMTGYSLEEVRGLNCRFLQGDQRDEVALIKIREAILAKRETVVVLKNFRKDGSAFWNELSLSPLLSQEGELTHYVGIQSDATARVEFEAALRQSEKLAAVGRLAASIAHEINNPLESVMNLIYLTERLDISAEAKAYLAVADGEMQRVKLITSQSLRFYKQSTKAQAIGCTELLESVLHMYRARLQNSQVGVVKRYRSVKPFVCLESEIRQVFNNLVSNAIDSMRGHGGALHVRTTEATDWRLRVAGVRITVADTGTGMSPEVLEEMYKAFYTTKGIMGTGLGLWISSEIITRHHGRILVRSSEREGCSGTVFSLFLPFESQAS